MKLVHTTRPKTIFYALNVNMSLSFDRLAAIAEEMLGANLTIGDLIVCDNAKGDKRKMLQRTRDGYMIFYARRNKGGKFEPLAEHNGRLKELTKEIL
jgi:hypothetical protein